MNQRRVFLLITAVSFCLLILVLFSNGGRPTVTTAPEPELENETSTPTEVYKAVAEETQLVLETLSTATGATSWSPEQPVASEKDSPYCQKPEAEQIWYIFWEGRGVSDFSLIAPNVTNTFANSDFTTELVGTNAVDLTSSTGLKAAVVWDEATDSVTIELASACFNANAGTDQ